MPTHPIQRFAFSADKAGVPACAGVTSLADAVAVVLVAVSVVVRKPHRP